MGINEKLDLLVATVGDIKTDVKLINQKLDNHLNPNQPDAKITQHEKDKHDGYTIKILGYFGGIVVFAFIVYEGVRAIIERGR